MRRYFKRAIAVLAIALMCSTLVGGGVLAENESENDFNDGVNVEETGLTACFLIAYRCGNLCFPDLQCRYFSVLYRQDTGIGCLPLQHRLQQQPL